MTAISTLVVALVILVPGAGVALALYPPGAVGVVTRAALCFALGCVVSGGVGFILAVAHILSPQSFFVSLAIITVAIWVMAAKRGALQDHWRSVGDDWRQDRWPLAAGLLVLVGFALVRLTFSPLLHMQTSTAWRYWADAVEIADAGKIPSTVIQYGAPSVSVVNKVYLNTLNAGIGYAIGSEPLRAMAALQWIGSIGLALALWSLSRELGLRLTAALLPPMLLANNLFLNTEFTADLASYKAETFSRLVAFAGAAMGVRALRSKGGWKDGVIAGVLLGVAAGIHIIPVIIAGALLGGYAVARLIVQREMLRTVQVAVAVGGVGLVLGVAILVLPHGDIGLRGATIPGSYDVFAKGFDPTLYLNAGAIPGQRPVGPRTFYLSPAKAMDKYVHSAVGRTPAPAALKRWWVPIVVLGGLVAAGAMLVWFPRDIRPVGLAAWLLGAALVGLTWLFSLRYHLYIPAWFGVRRLFDYSSIPLVLVGLAILEAGLLALDRLRSWLPAVAGSLLVMLVAAPLLIDARANPPDPRAAALLPGFEWIRDHTPCGARFLANAHTEGVFEALTGRVAVLEGATPFLRPAILQPIVRLLLRARDFFHDPGAHQDFLREQSVQYVVVFTGGHVGYREPIGTTDSIALVGLASLDRVFANSGMTVYRVVSQTASNAQRLDPSRIPGFDCRRGPIAS